MLGVEWRWRNFLSAELASVRIDDPTVRARFNGENVSFLGMERLLTQTDGEGSPLPTIEVTGGNAILETPAGDVLADVEAFVRDRRNGTLGFVLEPVVLENGVDQLVLDTGALSIGLRDGVLDGQGRLDLTAAKLGSFSIDTAELTLQVSRVPGAETQIVVLSMSAAEVSTAYGRVARLNAVSAADISHSAGLEFSALISALESLSVSLEAAGLEASGATSARSARIEAALERQDIGLSGPLDIEAVGPTGAFGEADRLSFSGIATVETERAAALRGAFVLDAVRLAPDLRSRIADTIPNVAGIEAHCAKLRRAIDRILEGFSAETMLSVSLAGKDAAVGFEDAAELVSNTGESVRFEAPPGGRVLTLKRAGAELSGRLSVAGGALPTFEAQLIQASFSGERRALSLQGVKLAPWSARGRTLAADLSGFDLEANGGETRITAEGRVGLSGTIGPFLLEQTHLSGNWGALRRDEAWSVRTAEAACMKLSSRGAHIESVHLGAFETRLCPTSDAPFFQRDGSGSLDYSALATPYQLASGRASGNVSLDAGSVSWDLVGARRISIETPSIAASYRGDASSIDLLTKGSKAIITTEPALAGFGVEAELSGVVVAGETLPSRLNIGKSSLSLRRTDGRSSGMGRLADILITASGPDPVFEPLVSDQAILIDGSRLYLKGPLHLAGGGQKVADSDLSIRLPSLDGHGSLNSPDLIFERDGLQPSALSERLRGLLTNAEGRVRAIGDVTLRGGEIGLASRLILNGLGFQTVALGRVEAVEGTVIFDDFLALSTPPAQKVKIGRIDPGLALSDGEVSFQLKGASLLQIEDAQWPFAGGTLSVSPGVWEVAALENTLSIGADALDLGALVDTFGLSDLEASGEMSGQFPLIFSGTGAEVNNARLVSVGAGGRLRYRGRAGDKAGAVNETAALAFQALEDFEFTVLEMGANGALSGDMDVSIRLEGRNREVLYGTPFAFNFSIDAPIVPLMRAGESVAGTRWLADAIVREE
ncbi:MAG: YdbH domain-containing protein [Pseudomonadota bacterium]